MRSRSAEPGRRAVLLAAGAGLLAGCTPAGDPAGPRSGAAARPTRPSSVPDSARPSPQEATIFDLSLTTTDRFRPFEVLAPGFVALEAGPFTPSGWERAAEGPPAPFAAVHLSVETGGGGATDTATVVAGLATDDDEHLLVRWDARSARVSLEVRARGRTRVLRRRKVALPDSFELAFAVCENQVTALVDSGQGWRPVLTERSKVAAQVDLRREEVLAAHHYAWGGDGVSLRARAGLFGMTGLRDPHLVATSDGAPFERDGRRWMTWTCAGLGFFWQAHWTVWSFDPGDPADMRLESQLFSRRDGLVVGDHAGQLVREGDSWIVATSSWGTFAPGRLHVRHTTTDADLLSGVHVLDTQPTALPTSVSAWDPGITRLDGDWLVSFVESPSQEPFDFHPALARTSSASWHEDLSPVFAASGLHQTEGPVLATVEGRTWLLASDGDARHYPVFDLEGRRVGRLDAPYPTNIPHPQLVPDPAGGWWMITFEGTQYAERVMGYGGHGDVVVMHST